MGISKILFQNIRLDSPSQKGTRTYLVVCDFTAKSAWIPKPMRTRNGVMTYRDIHGPATGGKIPACPPLASRVTIRSVGAGKTIKDF